MNTDKDESAGSSSPQTADGSGVQDGSTSGDRYEDANGHRWDIQEEEDVGTSLFPSARIDPLENQRHVVENGNENDESNESSRRESTDIDDDGPAKSVKSRKRDLNAAKIQASLNKKVQLDPVVQAQRAEALQKRMAAQNVVQKALVDHNSLDRLYQIEPIINSESGIRFEMEFVPAAMLSNELLEDLLALTRENMQEMYNGSGSVAWAWNDARKRGELRNDRMRWIIMRAFEEDADGVRKPIEGISTPESQEKGIIGFVAFRFTAELAIPHAYIHELQISIKMQGKGCGRILVAEVERIAKLTQMQLLMLTVFSRNVPAIRFYERMGFNIDEASPGPCYNLLDEPIEQRSPYEIMSKVLDPSVLGFQCPECDYRCRFEDTLQQHAGLKHGKDFPFKCTVAGCGKGTVHLHQLHKHNEIKHSIAPPTQPSVVSTIQTRRQASASAAPQTNETEEEGETVDYVNTRVTLKADGRKGTVVRMDKGFYTVRLDGPTMETIVCRASAFVGHKSVPVKKKVIDPDYELALKLQYEDGWARKSSRASRSMFSSSSSTSH